jgi:hypothetical protein
VFESTLSAQLKRIFDFPKVSYSAPGESLEQECLFIEVESSKNNIKDGEQYARVTGRVTVYSTSDKLPFGYFAKAIKTADADDTRGLFFFDFEENTRIFQNVVQRGFRFVYFFHSQYDPDTGSITSITLNEVEP